MRWQMCTEQQIAFQRYQPYISPWHESSEHTTLHTLNGVDTSYIRIAVQISLSTTEQLFLASVPCYMCFLLRSAGSAGMREEPTLGAEMVVAFQTPNSSPLKKEKKKTGLFSIQVTQQSETK